MILGVLGDIHGAFDALEEVMEREPGVASWLCVGDVAAEDGRYPAPSRPFFFIHGNNEDFDLVARLGAGDPVAPNLHYIANARPVEVCGMRVVGLGGTFAPKWYEAAREALPARPRDDKRRHFVRGEVEACAAMRGVDLFLTHEAPRPYWIGTGRGRNDAGKTPLNEVLASMKPRLHVFGHHHRFSEAVREGVPSVGLPLVGEGWLLIDTGTWEWKLRAAGAGQG